MVNLILFMHKTDILPPTCFFSSQKSNNISEAVLPPVSVRPPMCPVLPKGAPSVNEILYSGKHLLTYSVSRHQHDSLELIYCTGGSGLLVFDDCTFAYREGDVAVIPPHVAHSNQSESGFTNIHINMKNSTFLPKHPVLIQDDSNHFIRNAFHAVFYHYSDLSSRSASLLSAYGALIASYLTAYQRVTPHSSIVEEIERTIIRNYPDCNFELDRYLRSIPFNYDYLRKLFRKELGVTPLQYLNDKRLQAAAEYLCSVFHDGSSISEISHQCGFREPLYFSPCSKRNTVLHPAVMSNRDGRRWKASRATPTARKSCWKDETERHRDGRPDQGDRGV